MNELKEAALKYAEAGIAVFPLIEKDKKPLTANGFKDATTDREKIEEWWSVHPNANVGIATGDMSGGIVAIDMDVDKDKDKDNPKNDQQNNQGDKDVDLEQKEMDNILNRAKKVEKMLPPSSLNPQSGGKDPVIRDW